MDVRREISKRKLIAIVRGLPGEALDGLADALLAGGITLVEITFNQRSEASWKDTAAGIERIAKRHQGQVLAGAGTVMTMEQLQMAYDAGARYIISPGADFDIIQRTKALGLISMPGALTPTEVAFAHRAGADYVKVFPAGSLGPGYIRAVKAPLSHIPLMAVGGITESNAAEYLAAGAVGLGVGGNLVNKEWIAGQAYDKITALAKHYVDAVRTTEA